MDDQNDKYLHRIKSLCEIYQEQMPFGKLLGIKVENPEADRVRVSVPIRDDLVGNFVTNILHGGVIASVLDLTGALIASVGFLKRMSGASEAEISAALSRLGTIDLRVDYLRAGTGTVFVATGAVLRTGSKVSVARTELHNDQGLLIAAGTGTYLIG